MLHNFPQMNYPKVLNICFCHMQACYELSEDTFSHIQIWFDFTTELTNKGQHDELLRL